MALAVAALRNRGQKKSRWAFSSRDFLMCLAGNQGFEPWERY